LNKTMLQHAAGEVESSLEDGKNSVTPKQMKTLEMELNIVLAELTPMVSEESKPEAEELLEITAAQYLLNELEPLLKDSDPESLSFTSKLRLISGSEELIRQIEDFEFESATETLAELKQKTEGK